MLIGKKEKGLMRENVSIIECKKRNFCLIYAFLTRHYNKFMIHDNTSDLIWIEDTVPHSSRPSLFHENYRFTIIYIFISLSTPPSDWISQHHVRTNEEALVVFLELSKKNCVSKYQPFWIICNCKDNTVFKKY